MKNARLDSINTVERHSSFFTCAAQVAARYALPSQRVVYYLVSDSEALKADALAKFPDKVVVSGLKAKHTDPLLKLGGKKSDTKEKRERDVMEGAWDSVVESWSLAETDFRIITEQSGFGKIGASFELLFRAAASPLPIELTFPLLGADQRASSEVNLTAPSPSFPSLTRTFKRSGGGNRGERTSIVA